MKPENHRRKSYRTDDGHWVLWVDKRGRMTLPKALMREQGWEIGDTLAFEITTTTEGRQALQVTNPDAEARRTPRNGVVTIDQSPI